MTTNMGEGVLTGVKVADFSWAYVGPLTGKTLGDCGADVIKIEGRTKPDVERSIVAPFKNNIPGLNRGGHFNSVNTSKRSVALDLGHPRGKEVAKKIVAWADIVIENFAGGAMDRMGLGYEVLRSLKPDIIMLSSSMQGQTGPGASLGGFGPHLTSLCGIGNLAGWPDREPGRLGYYTDFVGPHFAVLLIAAALLYRRRSGKGMYIDVSQYEDCVHWLSPLLLDYQTNHRIPGRMGNRSPEASPHGAFRCRGDDRWCAISIDTGDQWLAFRRTIGEPTWSHDSRFATLQARKENEDELERLVEGWTVRRDAEEVMKILQEAGIPAGVLQTGEDLMEHDLSLKERNFYRDLDHPEVGRYRAPRPPYVFSRCKTNVRRAPLLGEDNEYVLKEVCGMSEVEIAGLAAEGVLE